MGREGGGEWEEGSHEVLFISCFITSMTEPSLCFDCVDAIYKHLCHLPGEFPLKPSLGPRPRSQQQMNNITAT